MKTNSKRFLPERFYSLDSEMSMEKILQAKNTQEPLVGKVVLWNSLNQFLEIDLGNKIRGYIPADSISIYPALESDGKPTASVRALIGKTVLVTVSEVSCFDIQLSRNNLMENAFNSICESIGESIECCITNITTFGFFVDCGNGVSGLIRWQNLTTSRFESIRDLCFKEGDSIIAKVISVNQDHHVSLSYKDTFDNLAYSLNPDDIIEVVLTNQLPDGTGWFGFINPNTSGLVDKPDGVEFSYLDKVICRVKGQRNGHPDQLRLAFVSFS